MPTLVEDESEGESEGDDDDDPPPRQWCVLDFSDARQAHLVCIAADQPAAHSDLAHAVLELNLGENPYSTHCFGFEQEHEARALVATLEQGYAAAAAYEPIRSPDLHHRGGPDCSQRGIQAHHGPQAGWRWWFARFNAQA